MSIEKGPNRAEREQDEGRFDAVAESIANREHPERNEDAYILLSDRGMFAALDGVTGYGYGAGKIGSYEASQQLHRTILEQKPATDLIERQDQIRELLRGTHQHLQEVRRERRVENAEATAVIAAVHRQDQRKFLIAGSVGDCRAYVARSTGELEPVTIDDFILAAALQDQNAGRELQRRLSEASYADELPDRERQLFINRNDPGRTLGDSRDLQPNIYTVELGEGDRIVITTDGVHDNPRDSEMESILRDAESPDQATSRLIQASLARSQEPWSLEKFSRAKPDDMTALVVEIKP